MHQMEMVPKHASHSVHVMEVAMELFRNQLSEQVMENLALTLTEVTAHKMRILKPRHVTTDPATFPG